MAQHEIDDPVYTTRTKIPRKLALPVGALCGAGLGLGVDPTRPVFALGFGAGLGVCAGAVMLIVDSPSRPRHGGSGSPLGAVCSVLLGPFPGIGLLIGLAALWTNRHAGWERWASALGAVLGLASTGAMALYG